MPLILHLSDLHFGVGAASDIDVKVDIDLASYESRHDIAKARIKALPRKPDYVIVSGDITIGARSAGFAAFNAFCSELIKEGALPPVDRFVVVPGNHDVARVPPFEDFKEVDRWKGFDEAAARFAHPWIPSIGPNAAAMLEGARRSFKDDFAGGVSRDYDKSLGLFTVVALPFIFDPVAGLFIYGFNSAAISGSRVSVPPEVKSAIAWLDHWKDPNADNWRSIKTYLESRVSVDPAQVRGDELKLFGEICGALRERYGDAYSNALKIAVLHHHVAPMPADEVKDFELLLNAAQFKRETSKAGFAIICHGHKHTPGVFRDAEPPAGASQLIVAGGTVGGYTPAGVNAGFYLIEPEAAKVQIWFVPISGANTGAAVAPEQRWTFNLNGRENGKDAPRLRLNVWRISMAAANAIVGAVRTSTRPSGMVIEGWAHRVGQGRVSATSTAFALRLLRLAPLPAGALPLIPKALATIQEFHRPSGGWSSSYEIETGMPETTGWVAMALRDWDVMVAQDELESVLRQLLDPAEEAHNLTFSVAHAVEVLAELCPQSELLPQLTARLLEGALRDKGRIGGWAADLRGGDFSAVHTAYGCISLLKVNAANADLRGARENLHTAPWPDLVEEVNRERPDGFGKLTVKHCTAPIAVRALLDLGVEPFDDRIADAITAIAAGQRDGLWTWPGGDSKPVWLACDAVAALQAWAARL